MQFISRIKIPEEIVMAVLQIYSVINKMISESMILPIIGMLILIASYIWGMGQIIYGAISNFKLVDMAFQTDDIEERNMFFGEASKIRKKLFNAIGFKLPLFMLIGCLITIIGVVLKI